MLLRLLALSTCFLSISCYSTSYVFVTVRNTKTGQWTKSCANYLQYKDNTRLLPQSADDVNSYKVRWWTGKPNVTSLCPGLSGTNKPYNGSIVPIDYRMDAQEPSVCSYLLQGDHFKNASQFEVTTLKNSNASAALLLLSKGERYTASYRDFLFADFTDPAIDAASAIPTFFMYKSSFYEHVASIGDIQHGEVELLFHRPAPSTFDLSMLIIWCLAFGSVFGGGVWAFKRHRAGKDVHVPSEGEGETSESCCFACCEKHSNTFGLILLMTVAITVLLLGYFFRPVLVVVFNIILVITGSFAIHGCLHAILSGYSCMNSNSFCFTPLRQLKFLSPKISLCSAITYLLSLAFCTIWFIFRRAPYAFIMLDIINVALCLHILKSLRLPSLKWLAALMMCMFLYDAFMVFVTPYITSNGCSVMVEVATGMDCAQRSSPGYPIPPVDATIPEKFPMLMQVMHFDPMTTCYDLDVDLFYQSTILGLGDIIIPGYLITHCFTMMGFEEKARILYGTIALIGYGLGLICTFFALTLMQIAQPALIYLVPCTLLPIMLTASIRKEFLLIWNGSSSSTADDKAMNEITAPIADTTGEA